MKPAKSASKFQFQFYGSHSLTTAPRQKKYFTQTRRTCMWKAFIFETVYSNLKLREPKGNRNRSQK